MNDKKEQVLSLARKLQQYDKGVTCDEFTTLFMVGTSNLPVEIQRRMGEHEESCFYHKSNEFHQSMLSSYPDMDGIEKDAAKIIEKYRRIKE